MNLIIWNFKNCLENPLKKEPYPIKKKQFFVRCLFDEVKKELVLKLDIDSIDQLEDLEAFREIDKIIFDKDKLSKDIIEEIGGINEDGEVLDIDKLFEYYQYLIK